MPPAWETDAGDLGVPAPRRVNSRELSAAMQRASRNQLAADAGHAGQRLPSTPSSTTRAGSRRACRPRSARSRRAGNDVTVLKAERAHLARPARLELLARAIGCRPSAEQYLRLDNRRDAPLAWRATEDGDSGMPPPQPLAACKAARHDGEGSRNARGTPLDRAWP